MQVPANRESQNEPLRLACKLDRNHRPAGSQPSGPADNRRFAAGYTRNQTKKAGWDPEHTRGVNRHATSVGSELPSCPTADGQAHAA